LNRTCTKWYLYSDNNCASYTQQTWVDGKKVGDIPPESGEQYLGTSSGIRFIEIMKNCRGAVTTVCSGSVSPPAGYYVEADLEENCDSCELTWSLDPPTQLRQH